MNKLDKILHSATRKLGGEKKAKHIAILSIVAVIIVTLVSATFIINTSDDSAAADQFTVDGITYTITDEATKKVTLTKADKAIVTGDITINTVVSPSGDTYTITAIGNVAFSDCKALTSVTIGNSVTVIGEFAFDSTGLTSVTIGNSVTVIGEFAFSYCSALTSVTIGNSVTTIGMFAFNLTALTSVTIGNSVTTIGEFAFYGCTSLTSITIPNSMTTIGECAFYGCTSLTSITIPNSMTTIGIRVFDGCTALTSVTVTGTGTAPTDGSDVIAKYFSTPNWGLPGRTTGITTLTLDFSNDYKYDLTNITTISTNERTIIFGDNANATVNGSFITKSGYDVNGADRAGFAFTSGGTGGAWETTAYKVTFNNSGGTGSMTDQFIGDKERALHPNIFTKDGYRFAGWSTTEGGPVVHKDNATITLTSDITLYAVWTPNKHTLSFDPNGGTVTPVSKKVTTGNAIGDLPTPTKDGYKFVKWQIDGTDITSKTIWTYDGNKTAKAVFEPLPTPDPVNPSPPSNMDVSNVLYIGFAALLTILLASLVAVLLRSKN